MKKQLLICAAAYTMSALLPANAQGDTTLKGKYERETILLEGNKDKYSKNHKWSRIGLFGAKLKTEFAVTSPESKAEIETFCRQRKRGAVLLVAGGLVFLSSIVVAPYVALPVFAATFGAGGGAYTVGAIDLNHSRRHLNKAVWLHNRDMLVKQ